MIRLTSDQFRSIRSVIVTASKRLRYALPFSLSSTVYSLAEHGIIGSLLILTLVIVTVYCGLKAYGRCKNKKAKILVLGATLAFFSYFVHGFLNNFLDTDKLAIPVWSLAALITAIDVFYADKEEFVEEK